MDLTRLWMERSAQVRESKNMKFILDIFRNPTIERRQDAVYREWDRLRSEALTPSHQSEIDAIFSRQV